MKPFVNLVRALVPFVVKNFKPLFNVMAEKKKKFKGIEITNRRAAHEYHFVQELEAGIMLTGTEIKSIRAGSANLSDSYCLFERGDLRVHSMYIAEYTHGNAMNHELFSRGLKSGWC